MLALHLSLCMDTTDRVPPALLQSEPEVTSPAHTLGGDTFGTIQPDPNPSRNVLRTTARPRIDPSDLGGPSAEAALSSTSSERFNDTSSLQPLRSNNDHLAPPTQQPSVRPPELYTGRRETKKNNGNEIDWIVPTEEKVSIVLILNLNRANSFKLKQARSRTHSRRTSATHPRHCYHREGQTYF